MDESRSPLARDDPQPSNMFGAWILLSVILGAASISVLATIAAAVDGMDLWLAPLVLVLLAGSSIGGLLLRDHLARQAKPKIGRQPSSAGARPEQKTPHSPALFRRRLATFLHVPESEVLAPQPRPVSSMPFWSSVPLSPRPIVMKSVEFIRAVLERIHAAVRR